MNYKIYLPPCYLFSSEQRYPVLYLLHGQGSTEDQWINIGVTDAADQLINSGKVPAFIMVFPYDYSTKQPTEYNFEKVFIQILIPKIDSAYRTLPDAHDRAIGGMSRGGAWALHLGINHPNLFGAIGGHSPAIFYSDRNSLTRILQETPEAMIPRIWIDAGNNDSELSLIREFESFLTDQNIPHEWHEFIGFHDKNYWSLHVNQYLNWYTKNWH